MRRIGRQHPTQVPFAEDQHPVSELGANGQHETFGEAVRTRTARWNLDRCDARIGQDGVERGCELPRAIADEEPESGDIVAEIHEEVAGLLGRPGPVGVRCHAQDVQVAIADLEYEQDV